MPTPNHRLYRYRNPWPRVSGAVHCPYQLRLPATLTDPSITLTYALAVRATRKRNAAPKRRPLSVPSAVRIAASQARLFCFSVGLILIPMRESYRELRPLGQQRHRGFLRNPRCSVGLFVLSADRRLSIAGRSPRVRLSSIVDRFAPICPRCSLRKRRPEALVMRAHVIEAERPPAALIRSPPGY